MSFRKNKPQMDWDAEIAKFKNEELKKDNLNKLSRSISKNPKPRQTINSTPNDGYFNKVNKPVKNYNKRQVTNKNLPYNHLDVSSKKSVNKPKKLPPKKNLYLKPLHSSDVEKNFGEVNISKFKQPQVNELDIIYENEKLEEELDYKKLLDEFVIDEDSLPDDFELDDEDYRAEEIIKQQKLRNKNKNRF